MLGRAERNIRAMTYQCYVPSNGMTAAKKTIRAKYVKERRTTGHNPMTSKVVPKAPPGRVLADFDDLEALASPRLTTLGEHLVDQR
jgi:hypothetical protein